MFHRDQHGVSLTAAGEALLPHARAALAAAELGRASVASLSGLLHGRLRVGVSRPADRRLAAALGPFHRDHPAIEIVLTEQHNAPWLQALSGGELDAALVGLPNQPLPPQLRTIVIATEPSARPRMLRRTALAWNQISPTPAGRAFLAVAHRSFAAAAPANLQHPNGPP